MQRLLEVNFSRIKLFDKLNIVISSDLLARKHELLEEIKELKRENAIFSCSIINRTVD
jgi:hypothetical protein